MSVLTFMASIGIAVGIMRAEFALGDRVLAEKMTMDAPFDPDEMSLGLLASWMFLVWPFVFVVVTFAWYFRPRRFDARRGCYLLCSLSTSIAGAYVIHFALFVQGYWQYLW